MKITSVIVDDEKPARERLRKFLLDYPFVEVVGEADNGFEAVKLIESVNPNLVFLDIQMPGLDGFKVIEKIGKEYVFIFVTAYDEYAIKAFEVNAIDYLLKPFSKQRFKVSMDRAIAQLNKNGKGKKEDLIRLLDWFKNKNEFLSRISVKLGNVYSIVEVSEIYFFRLEMGIVFAYIGMNRYEITASLAQLEVSLDPSVFFRANRNTIVNLSMIKRVLPWGINRFAIEFENNERIVVSRERGKLFKLKIGLKFRD